MSPAPSRARSWPRAERRWLAWAGGRPARPMRDADIGARGGLLDWWLEGGKRWVDVDVATEAGRTAYRRLAETADLVIETQPPGRLAELGIDRDDVAAANPALVQVSLTPFGRTGPALGLADAVIWSPGR